MQWVLGSLFPEIKWPEHGEAEQTTYVQLVLGLRMHTDLPPLFCISFWHDA
jgi:hypothetical protein